MTKNKKIIKNMKQKLYDRGFREDDFGYIINKDETYRYKFEEKSYRYDHAITDTVKFWIKIGGRCYKDI